MDLPARPRGRGRSRLQQSCEQMGPRGPPRPRGPQNFQQYPRPSGSSRPRGPQNSPGYLSPSRPPQNFQQYPRPSGSSRPRGPQNSPGYLSPSRPPQNFQQYPRPSGSSRPRGPQNSPGYLSPSRPPQNFQQYPRPSGSSRPRGPQNSPGYLSPSRPPQNFQQYPRPSGSSRPRGPQNSPGYLSPSRPPHTLRNPCPVNTVQQDPRPSDPPGVEQIQRGIEKIVTSDAPIPIGRGVIRGSRQIEYYRLPRPVHSMKNGKKGNSGSTVTLLANYFPITSYTTWSLYQYSVNFEPHEERAPIKKGMLKQHGQRFGGYIFDGSTLYTSAKLDPDAFELTSTRTSDEQKFIIKVKFTNALQPGDHVYIQVFNILLRSCIQHLGLTLIGRNFYDSKEKTDFRQYNLQLWPGYQTSMARYEDNILLCADISSKVIRQESVFDFFIECLNNRNRDQDWMTTFKKVVIGATVMTTYNKKMYRINEVEETSNPSSTFLKKDGSKISYIQYYQEKYELVIKNNNQPMLISKNKKKNTTEETLIYLVPEFCLMTGLSESLRNNFNLMRDLADHTRVDPSERYKRLMNFNRRLQGNEKIVNELNNWNLTLGKNLVTIPARVLLPEKIKSNNGEYSGDKNADWTKHLRSNPMYTCVKVKHWVVVAPGDNMAAVKDFITDLSSAGSGMSFNLPPPILMSLPDGKTGTYLNRLERAISEHNPSLILCVIKFSRGDVYSAIKRKLCVDRAVPSQVVLLKNVTKKNMSVCTKIAIQLNCKMGGSPWQVTIPKKKIMFVGFDVCHDSQRKNISYGALVATMDDYYTTYFSCVEPHQNNEEISSHFAVSVGKALFKYKLKNGEYPSQIFIYRDGVGEGQISQVHKIEIALLKNALEICKGKTTIIFIIVTKRISSRFFIKQHDTFVNPDPGTIIDSVVTDPTKYDFYLVSQKVHRGTVTPTHYQVIEDNINYPPDLVQTITYKLCHAYYNWSGTVRVPSVCQLAHKLAFLTGQVLRSTPNKSLDELLYFL
ncbi:piwi-like protein Siwi [Daktulosphaira vitifoliae]|uniref:piwi-like protein Siwi n=1 Tax=Daktulosphaira vitifoliae TaxID=58002 RepID=UPI0021AA8E41|nr:piwi-like protein Siwi [Daktulosphaira vitifoliae]XP_050528639.1 piwi-like protein Siwi [Daktulosphaira vitifoliae]XP_050528640.1 piwi-like protein Siwi [Daktulosphaira vitifoliae]XP_050528641.1 piwi-like protein Siwi [Daktulosphaira vitifoliae]XP_050528642.1 piwi-like protein Siwi [Daktulosphaira vitifoliae]XP_050528644.1 piwi-like protein Siwi [Daktulosphaira vitifoliae]XP_050528645.1 piwi-like protein Siwi [Daktulosphaira vitifoliae]XP_050528646.1 piwi-like protein Siwi [Daktulosphaira